MPALNKFNCFVEDLGKGVHNFSAHTLKAALTNTAPTATNTVLANITQISTAGGYPAGGFQLDSVTYAQTGGTAKLSIADETFTASGTTDAFRYVVLYNDSPTTPADPLIGWYDYGSSIQLNSGETFTIDFDNTNGVLTIA